MQLLPPQVTFFKENCFRRRIPEAPEKSKGKKCCDKKREGTRKTLEEGSKNRVVVTSFAVGNTEGEEDATGRDT